MRKTGKRASFRRNNVSFHTRCEKWVQSIIFTGTHRRRVITSCGHSACGPVENFIPRGIRGICDAFSAHFWFIIPRQRCLSWLFVVVTIRRDSSCCDGLITDDLNRLFISCEFHVCAVVAFPLPSHPSLLFPLKHCYPFLSTKRAEKWDLVSCTSSLLSHSFDETYPFAILICFFT